MSGVTILAFVAGLAVGGVFVGVVLLWMLGLIGETESALDVGRMEQADGPALRTSRPATIPESICDSRPRTTKPVHHSGG